MPNLRVQIRLAMGLVLMLALAGCQSSAPSVPTPTAALPTSVPTPTLFTPAPPTVFPTPTPPAPTVREAMPDASVAGLLPLLSPRVHRIAATGWAAHNAGLLLTPVDGAEQRAHAYVDAQGKTWVLGNFNVPVFQEGQVEFQPVFNTPDFVQLMGWVDNEGNRLYHIPLQPGVEGKAPIVYQKDNVLYEALVDLQTGKIDPATEKAYWQEMPQEAVKAVLAKYQDAIYVTFWDKDGKQLENERIKVCGLPPEPTPTPEPTKTPEAPQQPDLIWQGQPAPLGILIPERWRTEFSETVLSGRIMAVYKQKIPFLGSEQPVWMISVDFGFHTGKSVVAKFFLGRDDDTAFEIRLPDREYTPGGGVHGLQDVPVSAKALAESLQKGRQYAFIMIVSVDESKIPPNCREHPFCLPVLAGLSNIKGYNAPLYRILNGEDVPFDPNSFGYMRTILKPNWNR